MIRFLLFFLSLVLVAGCTATSADSPAAPDSLAATDKRIALSYDDAPRSDGRVFTGTERTQALLAQFGDAKTGPVAIFVTTQGMANGDGAARIRAYADAGHRIANHSHTHPWASRIDTQAYIDDIDKAEAALDGLPNRRAWFRFPFLDEGGDGDEAQARSKRDELRAALSARDIMSGYVTIDTYDWYLDSLWQTALKDGHTVDEAALSQLYSDMIVDAANHFDRMSMDVLGRRPAQVVLLHENDLAASFTTDMVAALRADGWRIIDPDEAFADPIAAQLPETLFSGMGRIAAIAQDAGRTGVDYFDHWSASQSGIDDRLAVDNVFGD